MVRLLRITLIVCVALGGGLAWSEENADLPNFFVAPIRTDVHRTVVSTNASAYATVNCNSVLADGKFDPAKLGEAQFKSDLKTAAAHDPKRLRLVLRYELGPIQFDEPTKDALRESLAQLARDAGFLAVSTSEMFTSGRWSDIYAAVHDFEEIEGVTEPVIDDDLARTYPLRTKLSKLVMVVGTADCVVEIKRPIDGRHLDLPGELRAAIKRQVEMLGLGPDKGMLMYRVLSTEAGRELVERLFDSRSDSPAKELAVALGFSDITYSHSPGGGAPETLLGMPAPNFRLKRLDGEELELHSYLNGRPALVTFWGVACGPCRQEAPHLTAMHAKYGADLAIVAVNGYEEAADVVSRYVEEAKLAHPIVMGGGVIADEVYHVGAYPTTFWINRDGIVDDYEVGFDSAAALERRIQTRLNE